MKISLTATHEPSSNLCIYVSCQVGLILTKDHKYKTHYMPDILRYGGQSSRPPPWKFPVTPPLNWAQISIILDRNIGHTQGIYDWFHLIRKFHKKEIAFLPFHERLSPFLHETNFGRSMPWQNIYTGSSDNFSKRKDGVTGAG